MLAFLENTWAIWWMVAVVVILRWFFLVDGRSESMEYFAGEGEHSETVAVLTTARLERTRI